MQSYRKRIKVQAQPVKKNTITTHPTDIRQYLKVQNYLTVMIVALNNLLADTEPLSDDWVYYKSELIKYKIDLERLETGTVEERKGVVEKHGE